MRPPTLAQRLATASSGLALAAVLALQANGHHFRAPIKISNNKVAVALEQGKILKQDAIWVDKALSRRAMHDLHSPYEDYGYGSDLDRTMEALQLIHDHIKVLTKQNMFKSAKHKESYHQALRSDIGVDEFLQTTDYHRWGLTRSLMSIIERDAIEDPVGAQSMMQTIIDEAKKLES